MANVLAIVCISSSYAGLFRETGFLDGPRRQAQRLCGRRGAFAGVLVSAVLTSLVACNQTLNIMLTHQLCQGAVEDRERLALALENTAVVLSPLIPWSIACAVPLGAVSAPQGCVLTACYLYLLPLWNLAAEHRRAKKAEKTS